MPCLHRRASIPLATTRPTVTALSPLGRCFARRSELRCFSPSQNGRVVTFTNVRRDGRGVVCEVNSIPCLPSGMSPDRCGRSVCVPATSAYPATYGSPTSRSGPASCSTSWCWRCRGTRCSGWSVPGDGSTAANGAGAASATTTSPGSTAARRARSAGRCRGAGSLPRRGAERRGLAFSARSDGGWGGEAVPGLRGGIGGRYGAIDGRCRAVDGRRWAVDGRRWAFDGRRWAVDGRRQPVNGRR